MSTKHTIAYGNPPNSDFHLYFDYADCEYHLDFYGENASQLIIPKDAMTTIVEAFKANGCVLPGNLEWLEQLSEEAQEKGK